MAYVKNKSGDGNAEIHDALQYLIEYGMPLTVNADLDIGDVNLLDTAGDPIDPATSGAQSTIDDSVQEVVDGVDELKTQVDLTTTAVNKLIAATTISLGPGAETGVKAAPQTTTDATQLTATMTCKFVWVGAPVGITGAVVNTAPVFIGGSATTATVGSIPVMPTNYEGFVIAINDPSKLYVASSSAGQVLNYRIFA